MTITPRLHIGLHFCVPTSTGTEEWIITALYAETLTARQSADDRTKQFFREVVETWIASAARTTGAFGHPTPDSTT